jgi:hypothetical protein
MKMRIPEEELGMESVFRVIGIKKGFTDMNKQPTFSMETGD